MVNVPRLIASGLLAASAAVVALRGFQYYGGRAARHHLETAWIWFLAAAVLFVATTRTRNGAQPATGRGAAAPPLWLALLTIPAAFLVYLPALRVGFLSDDFVLAARAAQNDFLHAWADLFRPIPLLVFRALGDHPAILHAANIALHGVNAALVARLAVRFGSRRSAFVAAALFVAFPASVEAVVWCSGVQDVLMTTLTLATLDIMTTRPIWSVAPLTAGLLTKETAVAAPILALVASPRLKRALALVATVVLAYVCWRVIVRPLPDTYTVRPSAYVLKELVVRAFGTLAVPVHAAHLQGRTWIGGLAVSGYVALVLAAAWRRRHDRRVLHEAAVMIMWIVASVAPVYAYFFITDDLAGSRYLYLASAGWSMLLAIFLVDSSVRLGFGMALLLCAAWAGMARANVEPWLRAAAARDQVLAAVRARQDAGCRSVWLPDPPDSVQGAFVFRNGLMESVTPVQLNPAAPEGCRINALER